MLTTDVSLRLRFSTLANRLRGAITRILAWRPGIATQLGIAFVGVAVLAAVANFAVQRTISITTTRIVPASNPSAKASNERSEVSRSDLVERPASGAAMAALERFVRAVETASPGPSVSRPQN